MKRVRSVIVVVVVGLLAPLVFADAAPLSPSRLSTLQGIELGMSRAAALERFATAKLPIKESRPEMAMVRMVFNLKPADFVFIFAEGKLTSISVALVDAPASEVARLAEFERNRSFLESRYGKPSIVDAGHLAAGWKAGDRFIAFRWHPTAAAFQLVFSREPAH